MILSPNETKRFTSWPLVTLFTFLCIALMFQSLFVISCFCFALVYGLDRELRFYYNREFRTQDLWDAIQANDTARFDTIISRNSTNLRETSDVDRTPLHMAVLQNNIHMTRALLSRIDELDIDTQDSFGQAALHFSCFDHNREITRLLIEAGADVNVDSNGYDRPIIMAQRRDDMPLLELLVNAGAQINFQDARGESPLHEAAAYGALGNVRYLINHGANLTLQKEGGLHLKSGSALAKESINVLKFLVCLDHAQTRRSEKLKKCSEMHVNYQTNQRAVFRGLTTYGQLLCPNRWSKSMRY